MGSPTAAHCRELYTWCRSQRLAAGVPAVSVGEMGNEQIYDKRLCRRMFGPAVSCLVFSRRYPGQEAVSDRAFRQPSAWNAISYVDWRLR